uniref:2-iminobutanoate/2-iminopropanoate deaminase n=2 Tax=Astatotilapia calliptera TaxID=8154 RepID=A0A3P8PGE5_ASTCA
MMSTDPSALVGSFLLPFCRGVHLRKTTFERISIFSCRGQTKISSEMAALIRRIISTAKAPAAIGLYSQAVVVDRTMYISGQLGMDPASGQLVEGGVQAQTRQALVNMAEILKAAGCGYTNVVKTTVLLADMNDFTSVNDVYKQFFSTNFPARAAYQVAALPRGGLVEIEAIAVLGPLTDTS